jgi:allophanate hydrolase
MDQFAIGLVGARSPFGACSSVFNEGYISGGSSSGSGVSVAAGLASFALGNDAAGSGRVPAAFNNIIGLKPTPGLVSNSCVSGGGTVKSIETISVFGLTCNDVLEVLKLIAGYDSGYEFSRIEADDVDLTMPEPPRAFRFGVPDADHLVFLGDSSAERLYRQGIERMRSLGGSKVEVDFTPFDEAQKILYDGPWIAERSLTLGSVVEKHREQLHPVTRTILESGKQYTAEDTFRAIHRLAELKCRTRPTWNAIDLLLVPTTPTIYKITEVESDPIRLNSLLGVYTNFANLMGLCGISSDSCRRIWTTTIAGERTGPWTRMHRRVAPYDQRNPATFSNSLSFTVSIIAIFRRLREYSGPTALIECISAEVSVHAMGEANSFATLGNRAAALRRTAADTTGR